MNNGLDYTPTIPRMTLVVPANARHHSIAAGSAIVAVPSGDGMLCHYEGGIHGGMTWEEKICHAAGRLSESYPTTAAVRLGNDDIVAVGTVEWEARTRSWVVSELTDAPALRDWRGEETMIGASDEARRRAAGLALTRGGSRVMMAFQTAKAAGRDPIEAVLDMTEGR